MKITTITTALALLLGSTFLATAATADPPIHEWTRQLGTSSNDRVKGVSSDGLGNVYISGWTEGSLGGPNAGGFDAFVAKFSDVPEPSTLLLWAMAGTGMLLWRRRQN